MSIFEKVLNGVAVYWQQSGELDRQGNPIYLDPVEIKAGFYETKETLIETDRDKVNEMSTAFVDRDMLPLDLLKNCALDDLTTQELESTEPLKTVENVLIVRRFSKVTNLKKTKTIREVGLGQ